MPMLLFLLSLVLSAAVARIVLGRGNRTPRQNDQNNHNEQCAPVSSEPPYNLSYLEELEDDDYLKEMVALFLTITPGEFGRLRLLAEQREWQEASMLAHRIKGSTGMVGAVALTRLMQQVESVSKSGEPDAVYILRLIDEANRLSDALVNGLREELQRREQVNV